LIKVLKDYVNILTLPAERLKKTLSRIEYRSSSLHSTPLLNLSALGRSISLNPSVILNFQGGRRAESDIIEKAIKEIKRRKGELQ